MRVGIHISQAHQISAIDQVLNRGLGGGGISLQVTAPIAVEIPMGSEHACEIGAEDHAIGVGSAAALTDLANGADIESNSAAQLVHLRKRRARERLANFFVERIARGETDHHRILARVPERVLGNDLLDLGIRQRDHIARSEIPCRGVHFANSRGGGDRNNRKPGDDSRFNCGVGCVSVRL